MSTYTIQQGECLSSVAAKLGLSSWKDLYYYSGNEELRKKRPNPNILAPGDVVAVPDSAFEKKTVTRATGHEWLFIMRGTKVKLRIRLQNWDAEPHANKRFEVTVGATEATGKTDDNGLIDVLVPAAEEKGHLKVWFNEDPDDTSPDIDRDLKIGWLDPVESVTGLQARLQNLGYRCEVNGNLDEVTLAAARLFRSRAGLEEPADDDALIDDALRSRLRESHEGDS